MNWTRAGGMAGGRVCLSLLFRVAGNAIREGVLVYWADRGLCRSFGCDGVPSVWTHAGNHY